MSPHSRFTTPHLLAALTLLGFALSLTECGGGSSSVMKTPPPPPPASNNPFWAQWGSTPQHSGTIGIAAQSLNNKLADIVYDPFVAQEQAEQSGDLVAHYQATLTDGNDFYMENKSGTYPSCTPVGDWVNGTACGPNAWGQLTWNVTRYTWENGQPVLIWTLASDWKPEPNATTNTSGGLGGWEPVFHPVLANGYIYVPGAGGTLWKVDKNTGKSVSQVNPFPQASPASLANYFVSGPLTTDATPAANGSIYYNVIWLANVSDPWFSSDVMGAWLVKVSSSDAASTATYASLVPTAPPGSSPNCPGTFHDVSPRPAFPWPPTPTSVAPKVLCGSQRPGVNVSPAIAADGTIYTVSRAHFDPMISYLVAANPDLSPKWAAPMQALLNDGCGNGPGFLLPIANNTTTPNSCSPGTTPGVDPTTNYPGFAVVFDQASSTPTVTPDGSILFGVLDNYNFSRGHLLKFTPSGIFQGPAYTFGWDSTPAVYSHNGSYSIVIKDNHYPAPAYCHLQGNPVCTPAPDGPYYITQLDPNLNIEWQFKSTTIDANHPNGYEWCVNAPVIDSNGVVYVNSEDGNLYSIAQGNDGVTPLQKIFLNQAIGAAYTPLSVGPDGKLYVQNDGHLFIVGN
jgi:hypothetical protein